jgi:hypothetical protein
MHTTTIPAPETDRVIALTPLGTATCAAYRLVRALRELPAAGRAEVLAIVAEELADQRS